LNQDESQLLAGAITLRHDPLFWRSVDGGTAGPLDFYALIPASLFPGTLAYAAARFTACLLLGGALVAAGEALVLMTREPLARMAVIPALLFEAFTRCPDLLHHSTEMVPELLIAGAVLLTAKHHSAPNRKLLCALGVLLGSIPYSKLQVAPIAVGLGGWALFSEWRHQRRENLVPLVISALVPSLLLLGVLTAAGQVENFFIPYLLQNFAYTHSDILNNPHITLTFVSNLSEDLYGGLFYLGSFACLLGSLALLPWQWPVMGRRLAAILGLLAVSVFCVYAPGKGFPHHLNILTIPLVLLVGVSLGVFPRRPAGVAPFLPWGVFFLCLLLPLVLGRLVSADEGRFGYYQESLRPRADHARLIRKIQSLASPGDALGLWGWDFSLYVETGLRLATRQGNTCFQYFPGPWQHYYLRRYYLDLVATMPPVFVDATGPGNFFFISRATSHETYPLLRHWLEDHYEFVGEFDCVRVYALRKLTAARPSAALPLRPAAVRTP